MKTVVGTLAMVLLGAIGAAVYLLVQLNQTETVLAATTTTLQETTTTLRETTTSLRETRGELQVQATENVELESANAMLDAKRLNLEAVNSGLQSDKENLATAKAGLEVSLADSRSESEGRLRDLGVAAEQAEEQATQYEKLDREHMTLASEHTSLTQTYRTVVVDYEALREAAGTADRLKVRIVELEAEVQKLEERRRPLILADGGIKRGGFSCTGSMEPVLTCLDEATWLSEFEPQDIVVGTTISFNPSCGGDEADNSWTAHRVMEIKVENGQHYYWPKGDNNPTEDGCWVPARHVRSYIVEIHRNVRPENAELRRLVNEAKDVYKEARAAYYALRDQHCERGERCTVPTPIYTRLVSLGDALDTAWAHFSCWQDSARASEYPGHIPHVC